MLLAPSGSPTQKCEVEQDSMQRTRFTTQRRAALRVKSFKAAFIRKKWWGRGGGGGGEGGGGGGGGRRKGGGGEVVVGYYRSLVEEPRHRDVDILGWGVGGGGVRVEMWSGVPRDGKSRESVSLGMGHRSRISLTVRSKGEHGAGVTMLLENVLPV